MQMGYTEKAERNANGVVGRGAGGGACNQSSMAIKCSADRRETEFVLIQESSLTACQRVSLLFLAISFSIREMSSISSLHQGLKCVCMCVCVYC